MIAYERLLNVVYCYGNEMLNALLWKRNAAIGNTWASSSFAENGEV